MHVLMRTLPSYTQLGETPCYIAYYDSATYALLLLASYCPPQLMPAHPRQPINHTPLWISQRLTLITSMTNFFLWSPIISIGRLVMTIGLRTLMGTMGLPPLGRRKWCTIYRD